LAGHGFKDIKLHPGSGGIFDVEADGRMIFRKFDEGRFPEAAEILGRLAP
jgi:predicted Rdx family selenoprotein